MDHLRFTEERMDDVEKEIARRMEPYRDDVDRLCTIPGVEQVTAWGLLAEIGFNMDQFPSAAHLASWAGLCPGNFESAGKRLSGRTRKAVPPYGDAYHRPGGQFRPRTITSRPSTGEWPRGSAEAKRAIIAVAHQHTGHRLLPAKAQREQYRELGANHFDNINADRVRHSW